MRKSWKNISLAQFQQIETVNAKPNIDDIDKVLYTVCILFGLTEYELDNTDPVKAAKLIDKVKVIFSQPLQPKPKKRIGPYRIVYEMDKMRFGQFIELSFFLSNNPLLNAHSAIASVTKNWRGKNVTTAHRKKSEYFLTRPITEIAGTIAAITERFAAFLAEYKSLFGLDPVVNGEEAKEDLFNKRYGWIYAASQIAEYERITLDEAYGLPIRQVFNDLAYLKAKSKYEAEQFNKKK